VNCTIFINVTNVSLSGVSISSPTGRAITVASSFSLTGTHLTNSADAGLALTASAQASASNVLSQNNLFGFSVLDAADLTLNGVIATQNSRSGLRADGASRTRSTASTFNANATNSSAAGVMLTGATQWTSTDDTVNSNSHDGVSAGGTNATDRVTATMSRSSSGTCTVNGNGATGIGSGIAVGGAGSFLTLTGCTVLANSGSGVSISGSSSANLGDTGLPGATNSEGNTLQSSND
jgi:hypothetical protein